MAPNLHRLIYFAASTRLWADIEGGGERYKRNGRHLETAFLRQFHGNKFGFDDIVGITR